MSEEQKASQATPAATLEAYIMGTGPKNEQEHWACGEITRLRELLRYKGLSAIEWYEQAERRMKVLEEHGVLIPRLRAAIAAMQPYLAHRTECASNWCTKCPWHRNALEVHPSSHVADAQPCDCGLALLKEEV